jgi:hypothetical protein
VSILDSYQPWTVTLGKVGHTYPIDTTKYTTLLVKMRVANEVKVGVAGFRPLMQIFWSRDSLYHTLTPTGGTYTTTDAGGNQVGLALSDRYPDQGNTSPAGSMEGGRYVIHQIPLNQIGSPGNGSSSGTGMNQFSGAISRWSNLNLASRNVNWGDPGITADSLRFDPVDTTGTISGQIEIDWVRLVAPGGGGAAETISWSGGLATYDIVISTHTDCGVATGDYSVIGYAKQSGFQFNPRMLPNGTYYIGLREQMFGSNLGDTPSNRDVVTCSNTVGGSWTVYDYPDFTLTSPSPTGSTDDFATTFLNDPWDFNKLGDVDFTRNIASPSITTIPAERPSGASMGNVRVYFGTSTPGTASTDSVGDPHLYTLFSTQRGLNDRIDASRYRVLTVDMGIDRARDIAAGSIARLVWHIAGETHVVNGSTLDAEQVSEDIPVRHMKKGTADVDTNAARYTMERLQFDMADRYAVPLETTVTGSPSRTGWQNNAVQCQGTGCSTARTTPFNRVGIDYFRFDFHEFPDATPFYLQQITLAAHQRTGASLNITWSSAMPAVPASGTFVDASQWKVRLYAVPTKPESSAGAGDASASLPVTRNCAASGVGIATLTGSGSEPTLASGSYGWTTGGTAGMTAGGLYFICAGLIAPGSSTATAFTISTFPIIYEPGANTTQAPRLVMDRTTIRMAARHTGANFPPNLSHKTPPQVINVQQIGGSAPVAWNIEACANFDASSPTPCTGTVDYVEFSRTSGSGTQSFTVSLKDSSLLPQNTGSSRVGVVVRLTPAVTGAASNTPQYLQLYIKIYGPGSGTSAPIGQVDLPAQGATGIQGLIGVTGWVLDDVGLSTVKIYRACAAAEQSLPGVCTGGLVPGAPGTLLVPLGDVSFVPDARPDIEVAFPDHPQSHQAGWGFGVLTNMVPRTTGAYVPYGGQGPLTFYVIATDVEGMATLLGRSWGTDSTPTTVTMDNDSIVKPFGVIDTPSQGGGASGTAFANFGWAITPDSDMISGNGDIHIPNSGTMFVFVDNLAIGAVAYNQCRGTVGNPVPALAYCNDDISNIFGTSSPQPTLAARTSNPSRFRNLDAGRAAIGAFNLNTTLLTNGLHLIAWSVTDNVGRVEGIGSRYFVVSNGVSDAFDAPDFARISPIGRDLGLRLDDIAALERLSPQAAVRTGWKPDEPWQNTEAADGRVRLAIEPFERFELALPDTLSGSSWEGYVVRDGRLTALPAGSFMDPAGRFYWQAVAGHAGDYDFIFIRQNPTGARQVLPVRIVIAPRTPSAEVPAGAGGGARQH